MLVTEHVKAAFLVIAATLIALVGMTLAGSAAHGSSVRSPVHQVSIRTPVTNRDTLAPPKAPPPRAARFLPLIKTRAVPPTHPYYVYDSANPESIPADAYGVAGYIDGPYTWTYADWHRFYRAKMFITIDILGGNVHADAEDVEDYGVPLRDLRRWARARLRMGFIPIIYCSVGMHVKVEYTMRGIRYDWWAAQPDGSPHILSGSDATQYVWGNNWDESKFKIPGYETSGY